MTRRISRKLEMTVAQAIADADTTRSRDWKHMLPTDKNHYRGLALAAISAIPQRDLLRAGVVLLLSAAAGVITALWWWALAGMSVEIGTATGMTLGVVAIGGLLATMIGSDQR